MKRFAMLTQDNCPQCDRLKLMLKGPLKNAHEDRIETVHRQHNSERFNELASQYGIRSTPALIDLEQKETLGRLDALGEVKKFIER